MDATNTKISPCFHLIMILVLCLFCHDLAFAKYQGIMQKYFLDFNPSAKIQSLGNAGVAVRGGVMQSWSNPAAIDAKLKTSFGYGRSNQGYSPTDYFGSAYTSKKVTLSTFVVFQSTKSRVSYDSQLKSFFTSNKNQNRIFGIGIATSPKRSIHIALRYQLLDYGESDYSNVESFRKGFFDVGILHEYSAKGRFGERHEINTGASLINFYHINFAGKNNQWNELPAVARFGASYKLSIGRSGPSGQASRFSLLWAVELINVLNGDTLNGLNTGVEAALLELFSIRYGLKYNEYLPHPFRDNRDDYLGLGISLPFIDSNKRQRASFGIDTVFNTFGFRYSVIAMTGVNFYLRIKW